MSAFATRLNYNKLSDGYGIKTCACATDLACVMTNDPQKVWRCNTCHAPIMHPNVDLTSPTEDLYPPPYVNS